MPTAILIKIRDAVILDYYRPNMVNPNPIYMLKLASALSAGECIQYVTCKDSTPTIGTVVACRDSGDDDELESDQVRYVLDSPIPAELAPTSKSSITMRIMSSSATLLMAQRCNLSETMTYIISSEEEDFGCEMREGQVTVKINCAA